MNCAVGSVRDPYDNALAESIIGLFKIEVIKFLGPWKSVSPVNPRRFTAFSASGHGRYGPQVPGHHLRRAFSHSSGVDLTRLYLAVASPARLGKSARESQRRRTGREGRCRRAGCRDISALPLTIRLKPSGYPLGTDATEAPAIYCTTSRWSASTRRVRPDSSRCSSNGMATRRLVPRACRA